MSSTNWTSVSSCTAAFGADVLFSAVGRFWGSLIDVCTKGLLSRTNFLTCPALTFCSNSSSLSFFLTSSTSLSSLDDDSIDRIRWISLVSFWDFSSVRLRSNAGSSFTADCVKGLLSRTNRLTWPLLTFSSNSSFSPSISFSLRSSTSLSSLEDDSFDCTRSISIVSFWSLPELGGVSLSTDSPIKWVNKFGLILRISFVRTLASNSSSTESESSFSDPLASRSRRLCSSNFARSISSLSCFRLCSSTFRHPGTLSSSSLDDDSELSFVDVTYVLISGWNNNNK